MVSLQSSRSPADVTVLTCARRVPLPGFRAEPRADIELCYVPAGWLHYQLGGEVVRVATGQLAVFWTATPHQIVAHGDGLENYFAATAPLSWFLAGRFPPGLVNGLLHGRMVCAPPEGAALLDHRMMTAWEQDTDEDDPEIARARLLELRARLLRLTLATAPAPVTAGDPITKANLVADLVMRRCTGRITVASIARELHVPPKQVGPLFSRTYKTSLGNFIARHRVFHAQRLLVTTQNKVATVAAAAGFGSVSRFNSVFRQACGCSPRDFRRINCGGR